MHKHLKIFSSFIGLTGLVLLGCMRPQSIPKPSPRPESNKVQASLLFSALEVKAQDKERIGLTAESLLYADDSMALVHVTHDGVSSLFNPIEKSWGVATLLDESGKFQQSYNLLSRGWLGLTNDSVKNLNLVNPGLATFAMETIPKAENVLGVGYDFLAFYQENALKVLEIKPTKASIISLPLPLTKLQSIQKCVNTCLYWAFDGRNLLTLAAQGENWTVVDMILTIPEKDSLLRLAGSLSLGDDGLAIVKDLYGLSKNGDIYRADLQAPGARLPTWENVAVIMQQSCIGCHGSDGYEQEAVLAGLKKEVLRRVDPKRINEAGAMPPASSVMSKSFTQGDAELIMAWLAGVPDTGTPGEDPGNPPGPKPEPNPNLMGELKTLADRYCVSCHADNQKQMWWTTRKLQVKERVESGDMPRNKEMSAADRKKLIELVQAL